MDKILVIDDEHEIAALTSQFLIAKGYEVRSLTDPRDGVALFRTFSPDLCLLDFNMPRLTVAEVFRRFKEIDATVEVIFLTAQAETNLAMDLMKAGAIDYLLKPVNLDDLAASVERALEHRRSVRANLEYQHHLEELVAQKTVALTEALRNLAGMSATSLCHGRSVTTVKSERSDESLVVRYVFDI